MAMSAVIIFTALSAFAIFALVLGLVAYYANPEEWSGLAILVSTLCLFSALLCVVCVPVDTYAASSGTAKEQEDVRKLYEALFTILLVAAFVLSPLAYFFYEEGTWDETGVGCGRRCFGAMQYTVVFEFVVTVVLAFLLFLQPETDVKSFKEDEVAWVKAWASSAKNDVNPTLRFIMACLACAGIVPWLSFTAFGIVRMPAQLLKPPEEEVDLASANVSERRGLLGDYGEGSASDEEEQEHAYNEDYFTRAEEAAESGTGRLASAYEDWRLAAENFTEPEVLQEVHRSTLRWLLLRPVQLVLGSVGALLSLVIWVSIAVATVDALLHGEGISKGYVLQQPKLSQYNAADRLLLLACGAKLDSFLLAVLGVHCFCCTVWAAGRLGVRCLCLRCLGETGALRPRGSSPQALLFGAVLCGLASLFLLFQLPGALAPRYASFGCSAEAQCVIGLDEDHDGKADCNLTQLGSEVLATRLGVSLAGCAFTWVDAAFVMLVPVLFGLHWAGITITTRASRSGGANRGGERHRQSGNR